MVVHSSDGCLAATFDARADRHAAGLLRWLVLGTAGFFAFLLAISHTGAVGAAAPATYDSTICINYFTCYNPTTGVPVSNTNSGYPTYVIPSYVAPTYLAPSYIAPTTSSSGYPANTVIRTYFDARYCNGLVSVVTDQYGNLIDVCTTTGQRIYPVFPDYGNGFGFGSGFVNANFVNNSGFFNGVYPNVFNNNGCPVGNFACLGAFPFSGFPFSTGIFNGNTTVVTIGGGKPIAVGAPYRVKEVAQPVAAPVAAAPAPAAPVANTATALNTSSVVPATAPIGGADIHVLSASPATTPAVSKESDDHRG